MHREHASIALRVAHFAAYLSLVPLLQFIIAQGSKYNTELSISKGVTDPIPSPPRAIQPSLERGRCSPAGHRVDVCLRLSHRGDGESKRVGWR